MTHNYKTFIILLLLSISSYAQKEAYYWYFGFNAGLNFSSGVPLVLNDGQIHTNEGVATISNSNGNLLFYTDGVTVWNNLHQIMPNGTGLLGSYSSSQSSIIVPKPQDPLRYYLFTVDDLGQVDGLNYSVVNMALDNGSGDIETKNIQLLTPVCEKITAVKHCNGKDFWVVTHAWNSDAFYSYLVTSGGINPSPVISHSGRTVTGPPDRTIGCMKASPSGLKLALAHNLIGLDLFNFDNATGIVSNPQQLFASGVNYSQPYGVEFSPDSKMLYCSAYYFDVDILHDLNVILQYNTSLPSLADIITSKQVVASEYWSFQVFGSLQSAPDGKIYIARLAQPNLSVINHPDLQGSACGYILDGVSFTNAAQVSTFGLPAFIQSYWQPNFTFSGACQGQNILFNYVKPDGINSIKWDFGDPVSGVANNSTNESITHSFTAPGIYTVQLIRYTNCGSDTVRQQVQAGQSFADLGDDLNLCGESGASHLLNGGIAANNTFLWQDGSNSNTFLVTATGLYWVEVTNTINHCVKRDSINVVMGEYPAFSLGNDLQKCSNEQVQLVANSAGSYLWNTGNTSNTQLIQQSGTYWLEVTLNGCTKRDSIDVTFKPLPLVYLGKDTTVCEDATLRLNAQNTGASYVWQNGSTDQTYVVHGPGEYFVKVVKDGCISSDTIKVQYDLKPIFSLGSDFGICQGQTVRLEPAILSSSAVRYLWQTGSTLPWYPVTHPGVYTLEVSNVCGSATDDILVSEGICKLYVPTAFSPNDDGLNDVFKAEYTDNLAEYKLEIFNRWGQRVFRSESIDKGWNGKIGGIIQPNGVYVWMIKYRLLDKPNPILLKGTMLLVR